MDRQPLPIANEDRPTNALPEFTPEERTAQIAYLGHRRRATAHPDLVHHIEVISNTFPEMSPTDVALMALRRLGERPGFRTRAHRAWKVFRCTNNH